MVLDNDRMLAEETNDHPYEQKAFWPTILGIAI